MAKKLSIHGSFEVPFVLSPKGVKLIDSQHAKEFWDQPEVADLASKQGVYVFALKVGKGYTPIYVGKSTTGFKKEIFAPHKLLHYTQALLQGPKGTPVMFFVAPMGTLKKVPAKICDEVETFLIQLAVQKNPDLQNDRKTKLAEWSIKGLVRSAQGKPSKKTVAFGKMIGMPR